MRACKLPAATGTLRLTVRSPVRPPRISEAPLQSSISRPAFYANRSVNRPSVAARLVVVVVAALALLVVAARPARAAEPVGAPIGIYLEGASPEVARAALVAAMADRFPLIEGATLTQALTREGLRLPVGASLTRTRPSNSAIPRMRNAATAVGADAIIAGRTIQIGGALTTTLIWIDPRSPDPRLVKEVSMTSDGAANKEAMLKALGAQLDTYAAAGAPLPTPKGPASPMPGGTTTAPPVNPGAPVEPPPLPPGSREPGVVSTAIVVANVAFEVGGRRFDYKDQLSPNTSSYGVFGVPMPSVGLEIYPAGGTKIPFLRDLGLTAHFAHAFGISSTTADGASVGTGWTHLGGALRARFRPGGDKGPMIGVSGGIDYLQFSFDATGAIAGSVPAVAYTSLRGGVDGRIPFWRMALLLDFGYDGALSAGAVHDRFKGSSVGGIDLGAGLSFTLGAGFELRLRGHYTRYFYKFHPVLGDAYVAGGALDEFLGLGLGVAYAY
jgi:hypothetical protein